MIIERHNGGNALFISTASREAWVEWMERGTTPDFLHPDGKPWAIHRERGQTFLYAGRLYATWSRKPLTVQGSEVTA